MHRRIAIAVLALGIVAGCADAGGVPVDGAEPGEGGPGDRDAGADGGTMPPLLDAGGTIVDAGSERREEFGGLPGSESDPALDASEGPGPRGTGSCVDGDDNDMDGTLDCNEDGCHSIGACCVGSGTCCEPRGGDELDFVGGCDDLAACGMTPFGEPLAYLDGRGFAPGGDDAFDSGAVLDGVVYDAVLHRVDIDVQFDAAGDCGATCLESAAVALTAQESFGETTHVDAEVGLVLSGSRDEVGLLIAGEVAEWLDAPSDGAWSLAAKPSGTVAIARDGVTLLERPWVPRSGLRVVAYGRNRNLAGGESSARIAGLDVRHSLCDTPSAWGARDALTIEDAAGDALEPASPASPTIETDGTDTWLAWAEDDDIIVAERDDAAPLTFVRSEEPVATGSSPALLWNGRDGQWELYYESGGSIARMTGPAPNDLSAPTALAFVNPFRSIGEPSVVTALDESGLPTWVMAVRAVAASGDHHIALFWSPNGTRWELVGSGNLGALSSTGSNDGFASGWDEIGEPALVRFDRAWHLYYVRRRGTRRSTGMLASPKLLWWRDVGDALLPGDGLDRVAVDGPSALPGTDRVELFYVADDGVRTQLARAERMAADGVP